MPVTMVSAPVSIPAVVSVAAAKSVAASVIAKAWSEDDPNANWRNEKHWAWRWWWWRRVIITGRGSAVGLNHIRAGVRAQSSSKPECEHSQCHHETFLSHNPNSSSCCFAD